MHFSAALPKAWLLKTPLILSSVMSVCGVLLDLSADRSAHKYCCFAQAMLSSSSGGDLHVCQLCPYSQAVLVAAA